MEGPGTTVALMNANQPSFTEAEGRADSHRNKVDEIVLSGSTSADTPTMPLAYHGG